MLYSHSCPYCANSLTISTSSGTNKWSCRTCPYEYGIKQNYTERTHLSRKQVDDVLGGADSWQNVDSVAGESDPSPPPQPLPSAGARRVRRPPSRLR